ncbi:MAG: hypothetical protein ACO1N5_17625, partial [Noviherbaspirillum sp.]
SEVFEDLGFTIVKLYDLFFIGRNILDAHAVQALRPWMLKARDTVLWGAVELDGIVVGCSGANPWYDEAFAGTVAMCLRAIAKARIEEARNNGLFLDTRD